MRRKGKMALALVLAAATVLPGMSISAQDLDLNTDQKEATEYTKAANEEVYALLSDVSGIPAADIQEMEFGTTPNMIWDIISNEKNNSFFKVLSKLS
jgi:hypothetical protein